MAPPATPTSLPGPPPVKRRKPHHKSRTGCVDCRRRRVKCDEARPICGICLRRGVNCAYPDQDRLSESHQPVDSPSLSSPRNQQVSAPVEAQASPCSFHADVSAGPRGVSPAPISPFPAISVVSHDERPSFMLQDLGLIHHWTLSTCKTIASGPTLQPLWQATVPQIACQHGFLMHGILCLAAAHLSRDQDDAPRIDLIKEAAAHHNQAIQGFNEAIGSIGEHNSDALFAFSAINIICIFALFRDLGQFTHDVARSDIKKHILGLEWVTMIRGVGVLLPPIHELVGRGPLRIMLDIGNWLELNPSEATGASAQHLRAIKSSWLGSNDAAVYDETLELLIRCFMFIEQFETMDAATLESWGGNRSTAGPMLFLYFAPEPFFVKLRQRQPPALLIFAFLGAAFHGLRGHWYMTGWGKDMVDVVDDLLGEYWRPMTAWPLGVISLE